MTEWGGTGDLDCDTCDGGGIRCVECGFTQDDPLSADDCEHCGGELCPCGCLGDRAYLKRARDVNQTP